MAVSSHTRLRDERLRAQAEAKEFRIARVQLNMLRDLLNDISAGSLMHVSRQWAEEFVAKDGDFEITEDMAAEAINRCGR